MIFLALYYLVALLLVAGLCVALYLPLRRFGRVKYVAIPVFFCAAILLIPMPIHGGFMLVAEVVFDAVEEFVEDRQDIVRERQRTGWRERFKARLPQAVAIAEEIPVNGDWANVILADGSEAWLDVQEGLVWKDVMLPRGGNTEKARLIQACGEAGPFTLALEIEMFYFYENQGPKVMPFANFRYPSLLVEDEFQLELVRWRNFLSHGNQHGASPDTAIRCVGRTRRVAPEGLVNREISAVDWNRFQLTPIR